MPRQIDFLGLSDEVPVQLRPGAAQVLKNLYRYRRGLRRRNGTQPLYPTALSAVPLDGLGAFRIDGVDLLLSAHGGSVYNWLTGVGPTALLNAAGKLTATLLTSFAWVAGAVYAGDGTRPNARITSTRVDQALPTAPSTALTATDAGVGVLSAGTYQYKVTFLSAAGVETEAGSASNAVTIAANRYLALTAIPLGAAGEDVSARRVYRTSDVGTTYLRVATLSDNVTTTYTDDTTDLTGNTELSTGRASLPPCRYLVEHHHRLCGAGSVGADGDERTLYISNFGEPEVAPASPDLSLVTQGTRIPLSGEVDGKIMALASHGDKLWVWTATAMFALTGDMPLDYSLQPFAQVGCVAHRTACSLKDSLYWLAADGVYRGVEGQGIERISDDIRAFIDALTAADLAASSAVCWDGRYYLFTPEGCRWYDSQYGVWGENTTWAFKIGTVGGFTGDGRPRFFAAETATGLAWELEVPDLSTDDGDPIFCHWASGDMDFGLPGHEKRLHYLGAVWKVTEGTASVSLTRGTGTVIETITQDLSDTPEVGGLVSRLYQRVGEGARSEWFAVSIQSQGALLYELLSVDGAFTLCT